MDTQPKLTRIPSIPFVVAGLLLMLIYCGCVIVPYELYFKDVINPLPGPAPGYLANRIYGDFAYHLSFSWLGFTWILVQGAFLYGGCRKRPVLWVPLLVVMMWQASYIQLVAKMMNPVLE